MDRDHDEKTRNSEESAGQRQAQGNIPEDPNKPRIVRLEAEICEGDRCFIIRTKDGKFIVEEKPEA